MRCLTQDVSPYSSKSSVKMNSDVFVLLTSDPKQLLPVIVGTLRIRSWWLVAGSADQLVSWSLAHPRLSLGSKGRHLLPPCRQSYLCGPVQNTGVTNYLYVDVPDIFVFDASQISCIYPNIRHFHNSSCQDHVDTRVASWMLGFSSLLYPDLASFPHTRSVSLLVDLLPLHWIAFSGTTQYDACFVDPRSWSQRQPKLILVMLNARCVSDALPDPLASCPLWSDRQGWRFDLRNFYFVTIQNRYFHYIASAARWQTRSMTYQIEAFTGSWWKRHSTVEPGILVSWRNQ